MTPSTRLRLVEGPAEVPDGSAEAVQDALLDAFETDADLQRRFEVACRDGAAALREEVLAFRAVLKERGHRYRRHDREHEETAQALYALAGELLPDSPAAALARLKQRAAGRPEARTTQDAIEELAATMPDLYDELVLLSSRPPGQKRLRAVAQRLWRELRDGGQRHEPRGFTDHVWALVRELFPEAPGAAWDAEWAGSVYSVVLRDVARHAHEAGLDYGAVDTSGLDAALEEMRAAESREDRVALREAGRRAVKAGRRAVWEAASDTS